MMRDPTVGRTDFDSLPRFSTWLALSVSNSVCLAAMMTHSRYYRVDDDAAYNWCLAIVSTNKALSVLSWLSYLLALHLFVGSIFEVGMAAVIFTFWCLGLPVIMNPRFELAVESKKVTTFFMGAEVRSILNPNLYFFAWISFALVLCLGSSLAQELLMKKRHGRLTRWVGLSASSAVVVAESVQLVFLARDDDCMPTTKTPHKCIFVFTIIALNVSVASCFVSLMTSLWVVFRRHYNPQRRVREQLALGVVVSALWSVGVLFSGSGVSEAALSNLYFGSWISFCLSVFLLAEAGQDFRAAMALWALRREEEENLQ